MASNTRSKSLVSIAYPSQSTGPSNSINIPVSPKNLFVEQIVDKIDVLQKTARTTVDRMPLWKKVIHERYMIRAMSMYPSQLKVTWEDFARNINSGDKFKVTSSTPLSKDSVIVDSTVRIIWKSWPEWGGKKAQTRKLLTIHLYSDTKRPPSILVQGYSTPDWVTAEFQRLIKLVDDLNKGEDLSQTYGVKLSVLHEDEDITLPDEPVSGNHQSLTLHLAEPSASPAPSVCKQLLGPDSSVAQQLDISNKAPNHSPLPTALHWQEKLVMVKSTTPPPSPTTNPPNVAQLESQENVSASQQTNTDSMHSTEVEIALAANYQAASESAEPANNSGTLSITPSNTANNVDICKDREKENVSVDVHDRSTDIITLSCPISEKSVCTKAKLYAHKPLLTLAQSATVESIKLVTMTNIRLGNDLKKAETVIKNLHQELQREKEHLPSALNLLKMQMRNEQKAADMSMSQQISDLKTQLQKLEHLNKTKDGKIKSLEDRITGLSGELKKRTLPVDRQNNFPSSPQPPSPCQSCSPEPTKTNKIPLMHSDNVVNRQSDSLSSHFSAPKLDQTPDSSSSKISTHNLSPDPKTQPPSALVIGDSNLRHVRPRLLDPKGNTRVRTLPGVTIRNLTGELRNGLVEGNFQRVVLHVGTNDVASHHSKKTILKDTTELINQCRSTFKNATIAMTQILPQYDNDLTVINSEMCNLCRKMGIDWIPLPIHHYSFFNRDGFHLNRRGVAALVKAIRPKSDVASAMPSQVMQIETRISQRKDLNNNTDYSMTAATTSNPQTPTMQSHASPNTYLQFPQDNAFLFPSQSNHMYHRIPQRPHVQYRGQTTYPPSQHSPIPSQPPYFGHDPHVMLLNPTIYPTTPVTNLISQNTRY